MQIDQVLLRHDDVLVVIGTQMVGGEMKAVVRLVSETEADYLDLVDLLRPATPSAG